MKSYLYKIYNNLLYVLLFTLCLNNLYANENNVIKGTVIDNSTGVSIYNVNISVIGTHYGAASDKDGKFIIKNIPGGIYNIKVSSMGYKNDIYKKITVDSKKIPLVLNIKLQPTILKAQDIVITGTRSIHSLKDVPVETNLISSIEINGFGLQTLTDAIRWVPGINISGGAPNGAARRFTSMIHGLPAQYSLILIDGQRAKSEHIHTGTNLNLVPIGMIERIEVVKGPASALYGSEAFGGVVNIITRSVPQESIHGAELSYGEYNTQNLNLYHGSSFGKLGYYINGNLAKTDGVPDADDIRFDYSQKNLLGKLSYNFTNNKIFRLNSRYYGNKYLRNSSQPKVLDSWLDISGHFENQFNDKSVLTTGISYSHFKGEYRHDNNRTIQADMVYNGDINVNNSLTSGFEIRNERFSRDASPQNETTIISAFIKDEIKFNFPLTLIGAARFDHHPDVGTEYTPNLGVMYTAAPKTIIRSSVGKGFRAPSLQDLYEKEFDHKNYYRDGNPDLKPEFSINYNLSIEHHFNQFIMTRISGFRNDFDNMIMAIDTGELLNNKAIFKRENIQNALAQGIETELRLNLNQLRTVFSYTYSDNRDGNDNPLAYSPKHMTTLRLYYYFKSLSLSTMFSIENGKGRYYKQTSGVQGKLGDYTLVNTSFNKTLFKKFTGFLRVENLFDQKFEIYEDGKSLAGYGTSILAGIKYDY